MFEAILVLGPEASGTRLVTRIIMKAGYSGSDTHEQHLDWEPHVAERVVWRRSLPHDNLWPDIQLMTRELRREGYKVRAVVTDRNTEPMALAQARDHVSNIDVARTHIQRCRETLVDLEGIMPVVRVQYEDLVKRPAEVIQTMVDPLGLSPALAAGIAESVKVYDANAKYEIAGRPA